MPFCPVQSYAWLYIYRPWILFIRIHFTFSFLEIVGVFLPIIGWEPQNKKTNVVHLYRSMYVSNITVERLHCFFSFLFCCFSFTQDLFSLRFFFFCPKSCFSFVFFVLFFLLPKKWDCSSGCTFFFFKIRVWGEVWIFPGKQRHKKNGLSLPHVACVRSALCSPSDGPRTDVVLGFSQKAPRCSSSSRLGESPKRSNHVLGPNRGTFGIGSPFCFFALFPLLASIIIHIFFSLVNRFNPLPLPFRFLPVLTFHVAAVTRPCHRASYYCYHRTWWKTSSSRDTTWPRELTY